MIKCPNCNAENMLGAIFCRECGNKLDIDNLRPEHIEKGAKKVAKKSAAIVRNLIVLVVLLVIGGIVLGLLIPPSYTTPTELGDKEQTIALNRMLNMLAKRGSYQFTRDESNMLLEKALKLTTDDKTERATKLAEAGESQSLVPDKMIVEFIPSTGLRFVYKAHLYGKVPIYMSVEGNVSIAAAEKEGAAGRGVEFTPSKVTVGRLPMIGWEMQSMVIEQYTKLFNDNALYTDVKKRGLDSITEISVDTDQLSVKK